MNFGDYYYTYILLSLKDYKLYIGFTSNLRRRIHDHENGNAASTKARRPLILLYFEGHRSLKDALRREKYFKTNSGKRTLRKMLRNTLINLH